MKRYFYQQWPIKPPGGEASISSELSGHHFYCQAVLFFRGVSFVWSTLPVPLRLLFFKWGVGVGVCVY